MTAVESRLATIIAEHRVGYDLVDETLCCDCGVRWTLGSTEAMRAANVAHERHLAAVIAGAGDLAVVEVPKLEPSGSFGDQVWSAVFTDDDRRWSDDYDSSAAVTVNDSMIDVEVDVDGGMFADEARRVAAGILAAAKAAEAVARDE